MDDYKKRPSYLDVEEYRHRREGCKVGIFVGAAIMLFISIAIHAWRVDTVRDQQARVAQMTREADALLMRECESIVVDLGEPASGTYEEVRDYRREIMRLQGR